jgi:hypothetical protein
MKKLLFAAIILLLFTVSISKAKAQTMHGTDSGTIGIGHLAVGWSNASIGGGTPDLSTTSTAIVQGGLWVTSPTNSTPITLPMPPTGASIFADVYSACALDDYIEIISTKISNLLIGDTYTVPVYLLTAIDNDQDPPGVTAPIYYPTSIDVTIAGDTTVA